MARQITYANDSSVSALDRLTGIDSVDRSTKNFTIEAIAQLFASTGLADVSKLAFFYNYNASNLASRGQAYYGFIGNIQQPAFINEIVFNRYDSTGKDFEPLAGSIRGSHIKLTAVGNAADTNYGLYEVLTNPTISGNTITVSVRHLASSGTLPNDEISISVLSSTATGTGVSVTDGEDPPVANATNHEGDLYIQIQEHETEVGQHQVNIWLYRNGVWVNEANLTGRQGEMGIQGFQGVSIVPGTASGDNTMVGQPTTFTVDLRNDDPNGPQNQTLQFTVPAGAKGNPGDNIDPALLDFENDSSDVNQINVTYNSIPIGNFDVQEGIDGRSIVGIVRTTGDGSPGTTDTYTITYDKGTPLTQTFDVYNGTNGNDGTNVTLATITNGVRVTGVDTDGAAVNVDITDGIDGTDVTLLAITDGVRVTGVDTAGDPVSVDVIDGEDVTLSTIANGVRVTGVDTAGNPVNVDIENGDNVNVEALPNGVRIIGLTVGGLPIQTDLTNGTQGVQGSVTFRFYRDILFTDPDPASFNLPITDTGNFSVPAEWNHIQPPATYDPSTDNLWIAEYEWDPTDGSETPTLIPILLTGPQGPGSGSSNVDGVIVNGTDLAVSESGTAVTTHVVPIAQGTTDNNTLVSKGYVDEHTGTTGNVKLTPGANQMITQASGTVLDIRGSFDLEDNAGGKSFDFSGTSGDIHIEDNGDIKLYFDKSSGKVFYDDANTGTLSTATANELATQSDIPDVPTTVIDGEDLTTAKSTLGIPDTFAPTNAEQNVQSSWDQIDTSADDFIRFKPTMLSDFTNDLGFITGIPTNLINGQDLAAAQNTLQITPNADVNVQSDWLQGNNTQDDYIQNKPTALSAFTNDEQFIDLQEVPVRTVTIARGNADNASISGGNLAIVIAREAVSGFTYSLSPIAAQTVGLLSNFTVRLEGVDAGEYDANITSVAVEDTAGNDVASSFTIVIAGNAESFEVTPTSGLAVGNYIFTPTLSVTDLGTMVNTTHSDETVTYQVQAAAVAPVQSDYFYYGFTNLDASATSANVDITDAQIADETAALDAGGFPAVTNVTREQFADGQEEIITFGSDTKTSFIAIPASAVTIVGGVVTDPVFHDLTLNPMGEVWTFDYMNNVEIGTTMYVVLKQVIDANARFRINF